MGHLFLVTQAFLQQQKGNASHGCLEPGPIITELGGICVHGGALPKMLSLPYNLSKYCFAKGAQLLQLQACRLNFSEGKQKCQLEPKLNLIHQNIPLNQTKTKC